MRTVILLILAALAGGVLFYLNDLNQQELASIKKARFIPKHTSPVISSTAKSSNTQTH